MTDTPLATRQPLPEDVVRLSTRAWVVLGAGLGILVVFTPARSCRRTTDYQAHMRIWLAAAQRGSPRTCC